MRQHLKWAVPLVAVVALIVACQDVMRPTESTPPAQGASGGQAQTMVTPSPVVSVVAGFPSNFPIPGQGGPSGMPSVVPGTVQVSLSTTTTSTSTTSTTSSTTTTSTFPGGCPADLVLDSTDTPKVMEITDESRITIAGLDDRCQVQSVEISLRAHRDDGLPPFLGVGLDLRNTSLFSSNVFLAGNTDAPATLTGPSLGSACQALVFRDGAPPFSSASAPYNGTFRPYDASHGGPDSFTPTFRGRRANGSWELRFGFARAEGPLTVDCWQLRLRLALGPG
jgi:hypothetical protein